MRFKNIIINVLYHSGISYPVPSNLTYWWNFGVLAILCLVIQILSGVFLAMHYISNADIAFISVEHIMRDINHGWLLRYMHANGASMFFLVVYIHIFRNMYYGSYNYSRRLLWCTGVIILLVMILTAFMGYVLPWGQMSFWAATVITNLVSAIPYIGLDILSWLWGGYAVDNATLTRFFSLHYLLPFILIGLVFCHIIYLHEAGSNNVLGVNFPADKIPFTPYFTIKDLYGILLFFILFSFFIFFEPIYLGHPDNFIPANSLVTPTHIVPEWYFLPFYAILRSVPDKLFGVLLLLLSILILIIFPFFLNSNIASGYFRPIYQKFFWLFFFNCILLGWIGGKAIEEPYYLLGQIFTLYYFIYFILILPLLSFLNNFFYSRLLDKKYIWKLNLDYHMVNYPYTNINLNQQIFNFSKQVNESFMWNKEIFMNSLSLKLNPLDIISYGDNRKFEPNENSFTDLAHVGFFISNILTILSFNKLGWVFHKDIAFDHNLARLRCKYEWTQLLTAYYTRSFLISICCLFIYQQMVFLFNFGDKVPMLLTFCVLGCVYLYISADAEEFQDTAASRVQGLRRHQKLDKKLSDYHKNHVHWFLKYWYDVYFIYVKLWLALILVMRKLLNWLVVTLLRYNWQYQYNNIIVNIYEYIFNNLVKFFFKIYNFDLYEIFFFIDITKYFSFWKNCFVISELNIWSGLYYELESYIYWRKEYKFYLTFPSVMLCNNNINVLK